jgi:hypothetical protein
VKKDPSVARRISSTNREFKSSAAHSQRDSLQKMEAVDLAHRFASDESLSSVESIMARVAQFGFPDSLS